MFVLPEGPSIASEGKAHFFCLWAVLEQLHSSKEEEYGEGL